MTWAKSKPVDPVSNSYRYIENNIVWRQNKNKQTKKGMISMLFYPLQGQQQSILHV